MLRLLGRYIFREIFSSAVLGTLLATFILFLRQVDPIFELLVRSTAAEHAPGAPAVRAGDSAACCRSPFRSACWSAS